MPRMDRKINVRLRGSPYDGKPLHSTDELTVVMDKAGPGIKVLTYRRRGTTLSAEVPAGRLGVFTANVRAAAP